MGELTAYGCTVTSVFQLIGTLENDITKSVAWALCQCPIFAKKVFDELFEIDCNPERIRINYQVAEKDKGVTDLEITDDELFYAILEAKRGWILPGANQLSLYYDRSAFSKSLAKNKAIITMSECSLEYANEYLPFKEIKGIPIRHKIRKNYSKIYVDEFQDTTGLQEKLVKMISEKTGTDMMADELQDDKLIVVGDPKQSIYRFTGAEKTVYDGFDAMMDGKSDTNADSVSLDTNFRSNKDIVEWVNDKFSKLMTTGYSNMDTDWDVQEKNALSKNRSEMRMEHLACKYYPEWFGTGRSDGISVW